MILEPEFLSHETCKSLKMLTSCKIIECVCMHVCIILFYLIFVFWFYREIIDIHH